MHWYENKDGSTKTHNRARTCESCREHPKGGCALPFRKTRKVRWIAALDKKPMIFGSLWFKKFTRSNAGYAAFLIDILDMADKHGTPNTSPSVNGLFYAQEKDDD